MVSMDFLSLQSYFYYLYKKIVLLPHKNRAVTSNAFHDNRHMWDVNNHTCEIIDFISGRNINLKLINNSWDKNKGNQHRDGVWICEEELT